LELVVGAAAPEQGEEARVPAFGALAPEGGADDVEVVALGVVLEVPIERKK
jgi:hypothetical protein